LTAVADLARREDALNPVITPETAAELIISTVKGASLNAATARDVCGGLAALLTGGSRRGPPGRGRHPDRHVDPVLRKLVTESDPASVSRFEFTAALPVKPWHDGRVTDALAGYEDRMLPRGFAAVRASRRYLTLAISGNPVLRRTALGFFRLCGAVPPLRQAVFAD